MAVLTLPTKVRGALRQDPKLLVLYGKPKVGKTTMLAQLPDNLIIDLERGTDFISALAVQADDYNELTQVFMALAAKKKELNKNPYRYITLDSASKLEEWAEEIATKEYKTTTLGKNQQDLKSVLDLPNGAGYGYIRKTFMRIISKFKEVSDHLILIGHVANSKIDKDTEKSSSKDLDLTGKLKRIVSADCDAIGYIYRDFANRLMVSFQTTEADDVMGSRALHLINVEMEFKWENIFLDDAALKTPQA